MEDAANILKQMKPSKGFFIGFDSDGCVFDTMEIKQKECFCPNTILYWDLQMVSKFARETWEFVNLYSTTRGCNRFLALTRTMELLRLRKEVIGRHANIPDMSKVVEWTKKETKLGNPALTSYAEKTGDPVMKKTLEWSLSINKDIARMVKGIPPFPFVRESLEEVKDKADIIVVSQTPFEALQKEWKEHGIDGFVRIIAGQELGTKKEHIAFTASGKYSPEKMLMVGDAPGDLDAAKGNNALFYPIIPGKEEDSWEKFFKEALGKFFSLKYAGAYEQSLIREFEKAMPDTPPWEKKEEHHE
jgi:phosphoglycolate phosphatase-like HAD superfamily hydrolase